MKSYLDQSLVQFIWPPSHVHPAGTPTALSLFPDCTSPAPGEEALASRCTDGCSMGAASLPRVALWSLFSKSPKSQRLLSSSSLWKAILLSPAKRPPPSAQSMLMPGSTLGGWWGPVERTEVTSATVWSSWGYGQGTQEYSSMPSKPLVGSPMECALYQWCQPPTWPFPCTPLHYTLPSLKRNSPHFN